jgi:hypothetical protein
MALAAAEVTEQQKESQGAQQMVSQPGSVLQACWAEQQVAREAAQRQCLQSTAQHSTAQDEPVRTDLRYVKT